MFTASVVQSADENKTEMFVVNELRLLGIVIWFRCIFIYVYLCESKKKEWESNIHIHENNIVSLINNVKTEDFLRVKKHQHIYYKNDWK